MGQALYRKYRSKSLSEIVGQEHITKTLEQALRSGRISHAYLFTGPRGVGKTSIARILAHEINGLSYTEGQTNLDIIEIDAASNRRIDEIRDLRDKVFIAPAQAKYKVYIIDEVHMLTKEAFNALLKTLEEPPAHVVFILATTESHKLPETIISRTQRFIFKPIDTNEAIQHLKTIAKQEKIAITDDALELIAEHGDGSLRDSTSLLDQASNHGNEIDLAAVQAMLGIPPRHAIEALAASLQSATMTVSQLLTQLVSLYDQGFQAAAIAKQLATTIRLQILDQTLAIPTSAATALLSRLLDVPTSRDPERYLEIVLIEFLPDTTAAQAVPTVLVTPIAKPVTAAEPAQEPVLAQKKVAPKQAEVAHVVATAEPAKTAAPVKKRNPSNGTLDKNSWLDILSVLKREHNTLYGVARMAKPDFSEPGKLELAFAFAFHQKRLNEAKNKTIISEAVSTVTGQQLEISCVYTPELKKSDTKPVLAVVAPEPEKVVTADPSLSAISNIFGGGELLQS
jgi:DNA polymerase-3 subunit gamma/tau